MEKSHLHRYQHYAFTDAQQMVSIKETEGVGETTYYCPSCRQEMIAKRGNVRQWHFAHKANKALSCSYDKYLHSIAEKFLQDWFNRQTSLLLRMKRRNKCIRSQNCIWYAESECSEEEYVTYDLKQYYPSCILEHRFKGYVADLFCGHATRSEDPIFLEIFVTHECAPEKKTSGIRIIEFVVESEEDIFDIIQSSEITESEKVRLYNFKRQERFSEQFTQSMQKFILYPSRKSFVDQEKFTCKNYNLKHLGIYEITMPYHNCIPEFFEYGGFYVVGRAMAYSEKYIHKDCNLCKWMKRDFDYEAFCVLYKKCGNAKYCSENVAAECAMFQCQAELVNGIIDEVGRNSQIVIWRKDGDA